MAAEPPPLDDYNHDNEEPMSGCYACGGRHYVVDCIDDICHGQDDCIHGDPPTPCRVCNRDGALEDGYY